MTINLRIITVALASLGLVATLPAVADTITPTSPVAPLPQTPATPASYTVTYPVTVSLGSSAPQLLNFVYNANGSWTAPSGWTYAGTTGNVASFTTTTGGTPYSLSLTSARFTPTTGSPATTTGPSVGANFTGASVTSTSLGGFGGATANGNVTGFGQTSVPLVGAPATAQVSGGTATIGTPIVVNPANATSAAGSAGGAVVVNSNQTNQSIGWGQYTATFPTTTTPAGTATVSGTLAGSSGSVGPSGISINNISGTATYSTTSGVVNATPTQTPVFSVDTTGNTVVGGTLGVTGATTLSGVLRSNGIINTGSITTGTLAVSGNASITSGTSSILVTNAGSTISGGGASVALSDGRATFSGSAGGAVTVTGIANGVSQYDAANWGQVQEVDKNLSRGIAGSTAVANLPQVDPNKTFMLGVGVGGYNSELALAVGGSWRIAKDGILKASAGFAGGGNNNTVWGVGGGWSW